MFGRKRTRTQRKNDTEEISDKPSRPVDAEKMRVRTLQRAVRLLAAKPRSIGELRERLLEKEWTNAQAVDAAIEKLKEYNYVDDAQFAQSFAASRIRLKPMGRSRVARDLSRKKIPKETADEALEKVFSETPESDLIDEAITRYTATRGRPATRQESKRLFDYLLRRGFGYDLIIERVRAVGNKMSDDIEQ